MNALALLGAVGIGLALGLTGSGGSILTLPVLVYLAGIPPREAVGLSLLIVGTAALAGAWHRAGAGELHFKAAGLFAASGMTGAVFGAKLTPLVPPAVLMTSFALLMVVVAVNMLLARKPVLEPAAECRPARCLLAGAGVGILTGWRQNASGRMPAPPVARAFCPEPPGRSAPAKALSPATGRS